MRSDRPRIRLVLAISLVALAISLVALGCTGYPVPDSRPPVPVTRPPAPTEGFSVVIDAGSQGSRLRVYQWSWKAGEALPGIHTAPWPRAASEGEWSAKVEPGLSAFADDPSVAGPSLGPLIDVALDNLGLAPNVAERLSTVESGDPLAPAVDDGRLPPAVSDSRLPPVLVLATGGLRRLESESQEAILDSVRSYLRHRGFDRIEAHVVSGRHEALFGWLGGNYILGRFAGPQGATAQAELVPDGSAQPGPAIRSSRSTHPGPTVQPGAETLGGLDLGGASTQIAYSVGPSPEGLEVWEEYVEELRLGDLELLVFVRSDLGFGQEAAEERIAGPDCYPPGFTAASGPGRGDYAACREGLAEAFRICTGEDTCPPSPDEFPVLADHFVAVSNYFYTSLMLRLSSPLSLAELESAAGEYCATPWATLRERHPNVPQKYLGRFCFSAAYIVTLLTEGYGFPYDTRSITALDRLGGEKIAWTVGALLYDLTRESRATNP